VTLLHSYKQTAVFVLLAVLYFARLTKAKFPARMNLLGMAFGMPMFAYLLLRSERAHSKGSVLWKGRKYSEKGSVPVTSH